MAVLVRTWCTDCGWAGQYGSEPRAAYAFRKHSCDKQQRLTAEREAQVRARKVEALARLRAQQAAAWRGPVAVTPIPPPARERDAFDEVLSRPAPKRGPLFTVAELLDLLDAGAPMEPAATREQRREVAMTLLGRGWDIERVAARTGVTARSIARYVADSRSRFTTAV